MFSKKTGLLKKTSSLKKALPLKSFASACLMSSILLFSPLASASVQSVEKMVTSDKATTSVVMSEKDDLDKLKKSQTAKIPIDTLVVNINTASAEELDDLLFGIGEKKAQAIVAYRKKYGSFRSIDTLKNVKGIGDKIVEKNRERIRL